MAPIPARVNLIFGEKWVLAKLGSGRCPVEVAPLEELFRKRSWKHADYRWLMPDAECKRTAGCLIRNDHHPRRTLRAGIPLMLEDVNFTGYGQNHVWCFEFPDFDFSDRAARPFHIKSALSGMYLTVDMYGKPMLDAFRPDELWRWHDATKKYKALTGRTRTDTEVAVVYQQLFPNIDPPQSPTGSARAATSSDYDAIKDEKLAPFSGTPACAFEVLLEKMQPDQRRFLPFSQIMQDHVQLDVDESLVPKNMKLDDLFPILFGAQSDLHRRFHERRSDRDLSQNPAHPLISEGAPWGGIAILTCKTPVPVLGLCQYQEVQRLVLCHEEGKQTLAVQTVGKVQAGRFGEFKSELLYLFVHCDGSDIVRFEALAPSPKGTFARQALNGYRKSVTDFRAVAAEILADWSPASHNQDVQVQESAPPSKAPGCFIGCCKGLQSYAKLI